MDLHNVINELGLQLQPLATEAGVEVKGQRSHRTCEGKSFQTPTQGAKMAKCRNVAFDL